MDWTVLLILGTAFVVAGFVKGTVGFGMPATAIAILGTIYGVREAIPMVAVPAVLFNVFQVEFGNNLPALIKRFWSLALTIAIGIWSGTHFMTAVDARLLATVLGVLLGTYAIISLLNVRVNIPRKSEMYLSPLVGAVSGVLAGLSATILVPFAFYMQSLDMDRDEFVRAISLALLAASVFWIVALFQTSVLTPDNVWMSAVAMVPTGAGFFIGTWCRRRMSQEKFRKVVMAALLVGAVNLLRKGLLT